MVESSYCRPALVHAVALSLVACQLTTVAGCGDPTIPARPTTPADDGGAPRGDAAAPPSRLASVGPEHTIVFDAEGYPIRINGHRTRWDLVWDARTLRTATATTTTTEVDTVTKGTFRYENDRVVEMIPVSGSGTPLEIVTLDYYANGSLARWRSGQTMWRTYSYDGHPWLQSITSEYRAVGAVVVDSLDGYGPDGCPTLTYEQRIAFTYAYRDGRLKAYSDTGTEQYPVDYDADGRIVEFVGTGSGFAPLTYEPGEARGLDLFPAHFFGGFVYGFPAHAEVFRLDGTCDATLSSQATILTLLVASLPRYSVSW